MTTQRKVRKDFNPTEEYSVDVSMCTGKEKEEVQQAFFDVGIVWSSGGNIYKHIHSEQYSNTYENGDVQQGLLHGSTTKDCNMTAKEFLELVYEPKQQGHVHAELMAQYAEDAKTRAEPWRLWEFRVEGGDWRDCSHQPHWSTTTEFRRKPKTRTIHGVEIPDLRIKVFNEEALDGDWIGYCADPLDPELVGEHYLITPETTKRFIGFGILYECTEEGKQAAILHAKAMLGIA